MRYRVFHSYFLMSCLLFSGISIVQATSFNSSLVENQVKATLYRFWTMYESENRNVDFHLEIFAKEGLEIEGPSGIARSHADIIKRFSELPIKQKNSHQPSKITILSVTETSIQFEADVTYQMVGVDGILINKALHYTGILDRPKSGETYSQLRKLKISIVGDIVRKNYKDVYQENRIRALIHHWFSQFDRNDRNPEEIVKHLTTTGLEMTFPFGNFTTHDAVKTWVKSIATRLKDTAHHIREMHYSDIGNGLIEVDFDLYFQSISQKGEFSDALVKQRWIVKDNPSRRYPEIQKYYPKVSAIPDSFSMVYAENRALSLIHAWGAILDRNDGNPTPFKDIVSEDGCFNIRFSTLPLPMTTFTELGQWYAAVQKRMSLSKHQLKKFTMENVVPGEYHVLFHFDWNGITITGEKITAETKHTWTIRDGGDAFARIKSIQAEIVRPFTIVK